MTELRLQSITLKGHYFCTAASMRQASRARLYLETFPQDALQVLCIRGRGRKRQPTGQLYRRHACIWPVSTKHVLRAERLVQEVCCLLQKRAIVLHPLLAADAAHHIQRCRRGEPG